jgi:ABC-type siderophore export system fused ATPase/permease subunit
MARNPHTAGDLGSLHVSYRYPTYNGFTILGHRFIKHLNSAVRKRMAATRLEAREQAREQARILKI